MEENLEEKTLDEKYFDLLFTYYLTTDDSQEYLKEYLFNSHYFDAPATTKYVLSTPGGLAVQAIQTTNIMLNLNGLFGLGLSEESIVKVGLLHNIAKADSFEETVINKKVYKDNGSKYDELGRFDWVSEKGYKYKDNVNSNGNVGFESFLIAKGFVELHDDEIIAMSNYVYVTQNNEAIYSPTLMKENPLLVLLAMAKLATNYLINK